VGVRAMKRFMIMLAAVALACPAVLAAVVWPHARARAATTVTFAAAGDLGANKNTSAVLNAVAASGSQMFFPMGDLSYSQVTPESAWCNFVHSPLGPNYPVELVTGNHEDNDGPDGFIGNFASCLPDRIGDVQGAYPEEYYFDYPPANPLVRFVMISPGLDLNSNGTNWSYKQGTSHYTWTANAIDGARAAGIPWVVVGMHEYCISLVNHACFISDDLMNLLVSKKVDLYLQAHDHAYSRTKQLALGAGCSAIPSTGFNSACVADANPSSNYTAGNGTVIATVGSGGDSLDSQDPTLAWAPYFQKYMGSNNNATYGFLKVSISDTQPAGMTEAAEASSAVAGTSNAAIEMSYAALSSNAATGVTDATIHTSAGTSANPMGSAIAVRSTG
jgi:calcineurin-like phosphoesterase family protein